MLVERCALERPPNRCLEQLEVPFSLVPASSPVSILTWGLAVCAEAIGARLALSASAKDRAIRTIPSPKRGARIARLPGGSERT